MTQTLASRTTTDPQNAFLTCAPLPVREEYLEQAQMNVQGGGDLESDFLTYAVCYAAATGAEVLVATGHPYIAAGVAIGAGVYALATAIEPDLNDQIAETVASGVDSLGDMVSETFLMGENLLVDLMNASNSF